MQNLTASPGFPLFPCNPKNEGLPPTPPICRRLKEAGKPEKMVRIAATRKLLLIAHAIYKSGAPVKGWTPDTSSARTRKLFGVPNSRCHIRYSI